MNWGCFKIPDFETAALDLSGKPGHGPVFPKPFSNHPSFEKGSESYYLINSLLSMVYPWNRNWAAGHFALLRVRLVPDLTPSGRHKDKREI
jgi:hypothetical protein